MEPSSDDLYAVLGVAPDATTAEITRAYRRLARDLHPDAHPADPQAATAFARIAAAHRVLTDPAERRRYDRLRHRSGEGAPRAASPLRGQRIPVTVIPPGPAPYLSTHPFGRARRADRGRDLRTEVSIPHADALRGTTVTVTGGPRAAGRRVRIPAGVRDGQRLRVPGAGEASLTGARGDLHLTVRVLPDPTGSAGNDTAHVTVPITYPEAATGVRLTIEAPGRGTVSVDVPPGTRSGDTVRVAGVLVRLVIDVPTQLDDRQRAALAALAATLPCPRPSKDTAR